MNTQIKELTLLEENTVLSKIRDSIKKRLELTKLSNEELNSKSIMLYDPDIIDEDIENTIYEHVLVMDEICRRLPKAEELYSNKFYNWKYLSRIYNIEHIFSNLFLEWDMSELLSRKELNRVHKNSLQIFFDIFTGEENPEMSFNYSKNVKDNVDFLLNQTWIDINGLVINPNISLEKALELTNEHDICHDYISQRTDVTLEFIKEHSEIKWNESMLRRFSMSRTEVLDDFDNTRENVDWCYNVNITLEDIFKFGD